MNETTCGQSTIEIRNGRPVICLDGAPVSQATYCDYITGSDTYKARIREFAESGVRVFLLCVSAADHMRFYGHDLEAARAEHGVRPSHRTTEGQAALILKHCPDARFWIRIGCSTAPACWLAAHPDDEQTDEDGRRHRDATVASPAYLAAATEAYRRCVRFVESRWGDRIVGYLDAPWGEGVTLLCINGKMFDRSPANQAAFRLWLRERYGDDDALRQAWADPALSLDTAEIPCDRDVLAARRTAVPTLGGRPYTSQGQSSNSGLHPTGLFHWVEPAQFPREHDYCRFMRDAFIHKFRTFALAVKETAQAEFGRRRLVGFDITKQPLMGWQIQSAFDGIGDGQSFPNILLFSGSWGVRELLDGPEIDIVFTPADYHARTLGFAYEAEGLTDSLTLRGKAMIVENDARCYVGQGINDQGAFRDDAEVEAGLWRNAGFTLSRGIQSYWCNVGSSYFHAPGIQQVVRGLVPMLDRLNSAPHRETRDAIAMVIDDEGPFYEDFTSGYQTLAVIWQRILGLAHCGVPYRILLLSDLERDAVPPYKVWLFPNLFKVDDATLALLRRHVLREGNLAVFGPATGITDGAVLSGAGASRLLGVPMELLPRTTVRHVIVQDWAGHPIVRELPAGLTFGDSLPYGPTLLPGPDLDAVRKAGAVPLGHATTHWYANRPGLFLKEFGAGVAGNGNPGRRGGTDYGVLWSCAMPLPAELLRAAARYAGCNIWCEEGDVVYASESIAALHSVKSGTRTLRLPRAFHVTDARTGAYLGRRRELRVTIKAPETRLFCLEERRSGGDGVPTP